MYCSVLSVQALERRNKSGGDSTEATPVPIPNPVVKLCNADDTWLETARESK